MDGHTALLYAIAMLVVFAVALRVRGSPVFRVTQPAVDTSLGRVREGVHRHRFADVASVDMILSLLLAMVLAAISRGSTTAWLLVVLVTAEVQHAYYGIPTSTQRWLFGYKYE